jgi:nucleotide-binding universal stress UspA family protein
VSTTYPAPEAASPTDIVIGIDDSPASRAALAWAADFARATGDRLRVVHVFSAIDGSPTVWTNGFPPMPFVFRTAAREISEKQLKKMFEAVNPEPAWTLEFSEGPVGSELVRLAAGARLLVAGTREHRGLDRIVSGSVSHYCLNHASCPVAAVPPSPEAPPSREGSAAEANQAARA